MPRYVFNPTTKTFEFRLDDIDLRNYGTSNFGLRRGLDEQRPVTKKRNRVNKNRTIAVPKSNINGEYYTVRKGDTFYDILKNNGIKTSDMQRIAKANGIKDVDRIFVGQKIKLPGFKAKEGTKDRDLNDKVAAQEAAQKGKDAVTNPTKPTNTGSSVPTTNDGVPITTDTIPQRQLPPNTGSSVPSSQDELKAPIYSDKPFEERVITSEDIRRQQEWMARSSGALRAVYPEFYILSGLRGGMTMRNLPNTSIEARTAAELAREHGRGLQYTSSIRPYNFVQNPVRPRPTTVANGRVAVNLNNGGPAPGGYDWWSGVREYMDNVRGLWGESAEGAIPVTNPSTGGGLWNYYKRGLQGLRTFGRSGNRTPQATQTATDAATSAEATANTPSWLRRTWDWGRQRLSNVRPKTKTKSSSTSTTSSTNKNSGTSTQPKGKGTSTQPKANNKGSNNRQSLTTRPPKAGRARNSKGRFISKKN